MIVKMLDLSTAHYPQRVDEWLKSGEEDDGIYMPFWMAWTGHGYIILADGLEDDAEAWSEVPEELKTVINYATRHGCSYVRFDCDGEIIEDLPVYEW